MFSYVYFRRISREFVRYKHQPSHWSLQRKKNHPVDKALEHFDDFYATVFGKKWTSIRHGLIGKQKYAALVNNYSDCQETMAELELNGAMNIRTLFNLEKQYIKERSEKSRKAKHLAEIHRLDEELEKKANDSANLENSETEKKLNFSLEKSLSEAEYDDTRIIDSRNAVSSEILHQFVPATKIKGLDGWIPESQHYKYYDLPDKSKIKVIPEYDINFPEHLNIYCYEPNNLTKFRPPGRGSTQVSNYYLMDAASILPVLALDLHPGQRMLDMCGAPGGKSLAAIQTLYPDCVVCNDKEYSRVQRIYDVFREFLYDLKTRWLETGRLKISLKDARDIWDDNFDRILVDVPCTTDRHSVKENDNNLFKPARIKERLQLPELQCELLVHALKLVKKGGIVVYSTCSLSPIQNDGVVNMALKQLRHETNIDVAVCDMSVALNQIQGVFKLADANVTKMGHLIVPYLPMNFGPMYFCKLKRIN